MFDRGKAYWLSVWDGCHTPDYVDHHIVRASERMLKRYGYLLARTTYGKEIHANFFSSALYPHCQDMEEVIYRLKCAIADKPIKKNGDLHQILKIMAEKSGKPENFYVNQFKVEPQSSCFRDTFFPFPEAMEGIVSQGIHPIYQFTL